MNLLVIFGALLFLMFVAYRGYSVILFAPVAAILAILFTDPSAVPALFTGLFMEKVGGFAKLYLPVLVLGAVFGKVIEISGLSKPIVELVIRCLGFQRAIACVVVICALLTYGGVSLFVVVFAVYPFASELFRRAEIPKRLIPATIAVGALTFTMDAMPGSPQIQNIIPTTFFDTTAWAAPVLGIAGSVFILVMSLSYLEWRRRKAHRAGETYGAGHLNEPEPNPIEASLSPWLAILPLVVVGISNCFFTWMIPRIFGMTQTVQMSGMVNPLVTEIKAVVAIWAVQGALVLGILTVLAISYRSVARHFSHASKAAVSGALLATMNTAAEYGFGAVIAVLPGFLAVRESLKIIPNVLVNEAITVTTLSGITGSASGGLSIALASMAKQFSAAAQVVNIPPEVLHRIASMASGGMDTLPHNGAVITMLAVTGLTHRQSYGDIFAITCIKTLSVFLVIAFYYLTGWV